MNLPHLRARPDWPQLILAIPVTLITLSMLWTARPAAAQAPGTAGDPLVTKSYLEQMFRFHTMVIPAGETLAVGVGDLLVLRSGRLKLRAPRGKGLVDLTTGEEIPPDAFIPANHLILVPDSAAYVLEAQSLTLLLGQGIGAAK
ncbi:MAG: hypothetical protein OZSIB_2214 [Candidatus Ozemobacter sibiricus]|jgi:hypothetical protein|uniref:Uncharacterized protein n=1 Tax=Candidatus Ozemobacter sibiricus TaxID=2268124 RepID=A0A367ZT77_9BACT|nr:MAG: hypothetical protein OZSIB_2214 [Candidatus Ozemobacter sibiricus]